MTDSKSPPPQEAHTEYPDPTPEMLNGDPLFEAIWQAIKGWDISRHNDGLYSGPTGNDARHIYDAVKSIPAAQPNTEDLCFRRGELARPAWMDDVAQAKAAETRQYSPAGTQQAVGRNRDPIYAPDGKTWYQTALDEAARRGDLEAEIERLRAQVERMEAALKDAQHFVDPDKDPPRITNRDMAAKITAALSSTEARRG